MDITEVSKMIEKCRAQVAKRVVGQTEVIDGILTGLIVGGHVLLEGCPGLAKTLAVKTFADVCNLDFKRIQFTPDLLPADVSGTLVYEQNTGKFSVRTGPIFTNLVLADEINRAPAKVQSALLEAMAEGQVTIGEETYELPKPFFVLATQNPIEQEGTYPLPEAELDRFLLKVVATYPTAAEEAKILQGGGTYENVPVEEVFTKEKIDECRKLLDEITCDESILNYIVSLVAVTRPENSKTFRRGASHGFSYNGGQHSNPNKNRDDVLRYISFGSSPRGSIALLKCGKVAALFAGRNYVLPEDIKKVAPMVLRHRLVLSYEAAADGVTSDDLVEKILAFVPVP